MERVVVVAAGPRTVDAQTWQAERFEEHRPHLRAVAYRMLGSMSEATTVVGRVCLDMLRTRRTSHEDYVRSWLLEPIVSLDSETDPEQEALLADSVGLALLVVLETLSPPERLAFVLHDMFAVPYDEIAPIVGRTTSSSTRRSSTGSSSRGERGQTACVSGSSSRRRP